jgi:hypothetical protein
VPFALKLIGSDLDLETDIWQLASCCGPLSVLRKTGPSAKKKGALARAGRIPSVESLNGADLSPPPPKHKHKHKHGARGTGGLTSATAEVLGGRVQAQEQEAGGGAPAPPTPRRAPAAYSAQTGERREERHRPGGIKGQGDANTNTKTPKAPGLISVAVAFKPVLCLLGPRLSAATASS